MNVNTNMNVRIHLLFSLLLIIPKDTVLSIGKDLDVLVPRLPFQVHIPSGSHGASEVLDRTNEDGRTSRRSETEIRR